MNPDTAVRLAASAVDEMTVDHARSVVTEYLTQLTTCPACGGSQQFTYRRDVEVSGRTTHYGEDTVRVTAGTPGVCPKCAGEEGDPDWVRWVCNSDKHYNQCESEQDEARQKGDHARCGLSLVYPLSELRAAWQAAGGDPPSSPAHQSSPPF